MVLTQNVFPMFDPFLIAKEDLEFDLDSKTKKSVAAVTTVEASYDLFDNIIKPNLQLLGGNSVIDMLKVINPHYTSLLNTMSTPGPQNRPSFSGVDESNFIKSTKIDEEIISEGIGKCLNIKSNFRTLNTKFIILCCLLIFLHNHRKTMIKTLNVAEFLTKYLGLRLYKTAFSTFWPQYPPNASIMTATIDSMDSNRFNIKKYKSIHGAVEYISVSHFENFKLLLDDSSDKNIIYYVLNLRNRIHLMVKGIANAYYENEEKGNSTGTTTVQGEDDEGDTYMNDVDNVSALITKKSRKIFLSFINDTVANPEILRVACAVTKISVSKMQITINQMLENKEPILEDVIVQMLSHWYTSGGDDIKSKKFIAEMTKVYSVSNSSNVYILKVKELLEKILEKYSATFLKSNNAQTRSYLKKTLWYYIVIYTVDVA